MELNKLKIDDIRTFTSERMVECEEEVRKKMNMLSMDIFSEKGKNIAEKKDLKKTLARILTIKKELKKA